MPINRNASYSLAYVFWFTDKWNLLPQSLIITHKFHHRLGPEEPSVVGAIEVSP
jgi:hypothetical protein